MSTRLITRVTPFDPATLAFQDLRVVPERLGRAFKYATAGEGTNNRTCLGRVAR
jgi:hypothetical protein